MLEALASLIGTTWSGPGFAVHAADDEVSCALRSVAGDVSSFGGLPLQPLINRFGAVTFQAASEALLPPSLNPD